MLTEEFASQISKDVIDPKEAEYQDNKPWSSQSAKEILPIHKKHQGRRQAQESKRSKKISEYRFGVMLYGE